MEDMDGMQEIIQEFLSESLENLDNLDTEFVTLEEDPNNRNVLASIFRTIHSIKGTCGFLGFAKLESVTHVGEDLLGLLRDGEILLNTDITNALLAMVDAVRAMLSSIENTGNDGDDNYEDLRNTIIALKSGNQNTPPTPVDSDTGNTTSNGTANDNTEKEAVTEIAESETEVATEAKPKDSHKKTKKSRTKSGIPDLRGNPEDDPALQILLQEFVNKCQSHLDEFDSRLQSLKLKSADKETFANLFRPIHGVKACSSQLELEQLEKLSGASENLLAALRDGEITLNQEIINALKKSANVIRNLVGKIKETGTNGEYEYPDLILALEELRTGNPLSIDINKAAEQQNTQQPADAQNTQPTTAKPGTADSKPETTNAPSAAEFIRVDVNLLDNLMNLVGELVLARNQINQYSKNFQDRMLLGACQNLNLITTELQQACMKTRMQPISTAWNKLPRIVRDLAKSSGKQVKIEMYGKETELDKSLLEAMKDPLTHMVRNAVDHGIEDSETRIAAGKPPEGTLTLRAYHEGGQVFIVINDDGAGINGERLLAKALEKELITPEQANNMSDSEIANLIFMAGFSTAEKVTNISGRGVGMDVVKTNIEKIGGFVNVTSRMGEGSKFTVQLPLTLAIIPTLMVRSGGEDFAIPQVNALELIRIRSDCKDNNIETVHGAPVYRLRGNLLPLVVLNKELQLNENTSDDKPVQIVVVQANHNRSGLVIDEIRDNQEIVVKPLSEFLKSLGVFAGATITGDGTVALILDVTGLAQHAGVVSEAHEHEVDKDRSQQTWTMSSEEQAMLIVQTVCSGRIAIPLDKVMHLRKFTDDEVEWAGSQKLVQYRGGIMPLININQCLEERRSKPRDNAIQNAQDADVVSVLVYKINDQYFGLEVGDIIDIVNAMTDISGPATREGTTGTVVIQGQVTELFNVDIFIEMAEQYSEPGMLAKANSMSARL